MLGETNCARLNETHMTIFFATAGTKIAMLAACGAPRGKTLMRVLCVKEQLISIPLDRRASRCDRSLIRSNVSSHARDLPITSRSSMSSRYQLIGKISAAFVEVERPPTASPAARPIVHAQPRRRVLGFQTKFRAAYTGSAAPQVIAVRRSIQHSSIAVIGSSAIGGWDRRASEMRRPACATGRSTRRRFRDFPDDKRPVGS